MTPTSLPIPFAAIEALRADRATALQTSRGEARFVDRVLASGKMLKLADTTFHDLSDDPAEGIEADANGYAVPYRYALIFDRAGRWTSIAEVSTAHDRRPTVPGRGRQTQTRA